jgi:hypothetical protein
MVVSGCVVVLVLAPVVSVLFGSEVGCGVSQAPIANVDAILRMINNFFIDHYLQVTRIAYSNNDSIILPSAGIDALIR